LEEELEITKLRVDKETKREKYKKRNRRRESGRKREK
jgi:hypothetical protein